MTFLSLVPLSILCGVLGNNYSKNSADAPLCSRLNALFERRGFNVRQGIHVAPFVKLALENSAKFEILARFCSFFRLVKEKRSDFVSRGWKFAVLRVEIIRVER